jgi:outer membrane protein TolC
VREAELRAQAGLVGPNQVANAKTFWAEQELLLIDMEELLDARSDVLASLMGVRPGAGEARFRTVEEPAVEFPTESEDALVSLARQNNLELQAAGREVEAARVLADAAKWESLPDVDLTGSLGGSGLAGRNQEVIFGTDTLRVDRGGDFGDALSQVARRTYPSWSLGVQVSFPLGLRSGLGEKDRLEALVLDAEQRRIGQSRTLEEQVRAVYREMANGKRRLEFAREGVDAAQEQVRIGIIEFRNGRLTAFELVRLGADFAVAQRRYSQALVRTAKAGAALRLLTSGKFLSTTIE